MHILQKGETFVSPLSLLQKIRWTDMWVGSRLKGLILCELVLCPLVSKEGGSCP